MTSQPAAGDPFVKAIFLLLVIASFAAFFVTQRLKHTPTVVQEFKLTPFFSPTRTGHIKREQISFKIADADRVTVTVVNLAGEEVARLLNRYRLDAYRHVSLRWNGRLGRHSTGRRAPEGEYRVQVDLAREKAVRLSPRTFKLVRHPKTVSG